MSIELELEPFSLNSEPLPEKRGRKPDPESRRYNCALHRIAKGKYLDIGGVVHELAILTGLSMEAIRDRIAVAEHDYAPEPLECGTGWTADDRKYLSSRYGKLKDPAVREFLQGLGGGNRRNPDREDARVKRERITKSDGSTKLISVAIDPSKN